MDKRKMIAEIAARHGVRLDPDDPAFLLVELNHMMFEEKEAGLKAETEAAEKRVTSLIGLLQKAGDAYRGQLETYTNAQAGTVMTTIKEVGAGSLEQIEKAGGDAQRQIKTDAAGVKLDLDRAVAGAMEEVKRTVKTTIQTAMASPVQDVVRTLQQNTWTNMLFCFLAGLVGGAIPVLILALRH